MKKQIGFVGLGLMGSAMAGRLMKAGHPLVVHNRTKERATALLSQGALWAENPGEVAGRCDLVFSMLSTTEALRSVALGRDGILNGLKPGCTHIDCSTVAPGITHQLEQSYDAAGRLFLHMPVLGSVSQATEGTLLLMAGGNEKAFEASETVIRILGGKVWRFEHAEQASNAKLLCNFFIAGMITTLAQALPFADRASVSPTVLLDIIGNSALHAPMYQTKGKSMVERNFTPRFFVEHMLKDIRLMLESANSLDVHLPGAEVAERLFQSAVEQGLGKEDYSAVIKVLQRSGAR